MKISLELDDTALANRITARHEVTITDSFEPSSAEGHWPIVMEGEPLEIIRALFAITGGSTALSAEILEANGVMVTQLDQEDVAWCLANGGHDFVNGQCKACDTYC